MPVSKINIDAFLELAATLPVMDVRSPSEFIHAHIPGAYSLPLFSDEERKIVGTQYKQEGRQPAIKTGLDFFSVKMRPMVEAAEIYIRNFAPQNNTVLVHCWRGGMRSAAIAWLLDLYGFKVYTLSGGYKAYRNHVIEQFGKNYCLQVLGGYTGSGKTGILKQLEQQGQAVIDLELLAGHKGSAFGGIGQAVQHGQEMFENVLAGELMKHSETSFWVEDESQRIGLVNIPQAFWKSLRSKPVLFIDIPFEARLQYIHREYGSLDKAALIDAIARIQKRLGPAEAKAAIQCLQDNDHMGAFRILLKYYDEAYLKSLNSRENISSRIKTVSFAQVDIIHNSNIIACAALSV